MWCLAWNTCYITELFLSCQVVCVCAGKSMFCDGSVWLALGIAHVRGVSGSACWLRAVG